MFSHKKVISVERGLPVPQNSKYLRTETSREEIHTWGVMKRDGKFDIYEVPCNQDGTTELKVTYESKPEFNPNDNGCGCYQRWCPTCG